LSPGPGRHACITEEVTVHPPKERRADPINRIWDVGRVRSDSLAVRRRSEQDLDACARLLRLVHEEDGYPRIWPTSPRTWLAPDDQVGAWVADDGERVLGHVAVAEPDASPATAVWSAALDVGPAAMLRVSLLIVAPCARGRGLGARLLEAAALFAGDRGAQPVLEVVSSDRGAVALYSRLGWRQVGSLQPGWLPQPDRTLLFVAPQRSAS
jgi:GNAT superfamily N-acetyltransferase